MSTLPDPRTRKMEEFLDAEHFRFRRSTEAVAGPDDIELTSEWSLRLEAPKTDLTRRMIADFGQFCQRCMGIELRQTGDGTSVVWSLTEPLSDPINPQDPEVETFGIVVSAQEIRIEARHERGLLRGTHHLEWMMADRGGPILALGTTHHRPAFMPRISNGVFITGNQTFSNPGRFTDEYLGLMSHFGVNGIHLYVDFWNIFRSATLPELNSPDFDGQIAALRAFNQRLLAYGIDLYLHINTPPLDENHPVFLAHPEVKGARVEIFFEELSGRPWHNLCSGSETTLRAYTEAIQALFSAASEAAGMVMIVGGECFYHCFTRPDQSVSGETNCPRCRGRDPSAEVANLANTAARAVKATGAHKSFYAWPYSAFIWSAKDPSQTRWVSLLDPAVSVMTNFACGDEGPSGVRYFDYNISCIGPSQTFADQAAVRHQQGRPIFTKIETCTTPDAFFLPYLPLYRRWYRRLEAMKDVPAAGFIGQWRFFGMNGSPPEEFQYRMTWGNASCEDLLRLRARRDLGLDAVGAGQAVAAWDDLSAAWDYYPYSAMTSGERHAYMRGPFYLGPAHPLIFDVQSRYQLPDAFFSLRGDLAEMTLTEEELLELRRNSKPRYVSDLLVTLPYGTEEYLRLLGECRRLWTRGLETLRGLLEGKGERAQMELDVCVTIDAHLQSLENTVKFYHARDILQNSPSTMEDFDGRLQVLQEILDAEIANAEAMLPVLRRDPRIGYGFCYGPVYDTAMIEAKIRQCRFVRDVELPRFSQVIRFHIWLESA